MVSIVFSWEGIFTGLDVRVLSIVVRVSSSGISWIL